MPVAAVQPAIQDMIASRRLGGRITWAISIGGRCWRRLAAVAATGGAAFAQAPGASAARTAEGPARLARSRPAGAGRRLRPVEIRAQPSAGGGALRDQQRAGEGAARRAEAARLRTDADRGTGPLHRQTAERAGAYLHSRRNVAHGPRNGLSVSGRDLPACRRALYLARLHQRARRQGRPGADGRSGAPRGRLDPQERRELRRRSEPALSLRPFVGRTSRGRRAGDRLGEGLTACRRTCSRAGCAAPACST